MFKKISNLGSELNKEEQKSIIGGKLDGSGIGNPGGSGGDGFICYCDGENLGLADSVWACRFRCFGHNI